MKQRPFESVGITGQRLALANEPLQQELLSEPLRQPLKQWTERLPRETSIFSWFVMQTDGLQIARYPEISGGENTIGENYSWRAYFHGGTEDKPHDWRADAGQHLDRTQISPPFFTEHTYEWVLVVSTPIPDPQSAAGPPLGVLGLMLRLVELPGNALRGDASAANRFAVLIDSRPAHAGQILQHPRSASWNSSPRRERNSSPIPGKKHCGFRGIGPGTPITAIPWSSNLPAPGSSVG